MLLMVLCYFNVLFIFIVFVLLVVVYVLGNVIKVWFGYLMFVVVKLWVFGYLFVVGMLYDVLLFGVFLLWVVVDFMVLWCCDCVVGVMYLKGLVWCIVFIVVFGVIVWVVFVFWLYRLFVGVSLFG